MTDDRMHARAAKRGVGMLRLAGRASAGLVRKPAGHNTARETGPVLGTVVST
jgi:hypothetical protein